jgi:acyl-CoA reductase-like NAD-dependent aldehyde dehydrogenase
MTYDYPRIGLLIQGEWTRATAEDLRNALVSVDRAGLTWRDTAPDARVHILRRAAQLLRERSKIISHTISLELGKPLSDSVREVKRAAAIMGGMPAKPSGSMGASTRLHPVCSKWSCASRSAP